MGASYLLTGADAATTDEKLRSLSLHDDARIAALSSAQRWRSEIATASQPQIDGWRVQIDKAPEQLRGGPYFLLGLALANTSQYEPAALAFMRVPILYPRQRELAARALLEAGRAMEKLDRPSEAGQLYREVLSRHKQDPAAIEAEQRVEALVGDP